MCPEPRRVIMTDDHSDQSDIGIDPACGEQAIDKRILYVGPTMAHFEDLVSGLAGAVGCEAETSAAARVVVCRHVQMCFAGTTEVEEALRLLRTGYFNLVMVDARGAVGRQPDPARAMALLDGMEQAPDVEARYGFHRVVVLVSGMGGDGVDQLIAAFGARRVGRVIRDASDGPCLDGPAAPHRNPAFFRLVADEAMRIMLASRRGKRALCASGGGITGIYFEMGVLKCLSDCLTPSLSEAFDMFFGISAGAVVTGFMANGYSIDEAMGAVAGVRGLRLPPTTLSVFRFEHIDFRGFGWRMVTITRQIGAVLRQALRGRRKVSLESLMIDYSDLLGPPFHGDGFEAMLRRAFEAPGATNDFRRLRKPLYIGATDQDARTHVLFGEDGHDDVPISKAIQASLSINPAFRAAPIQGRYYEDGAVTRTSHFVEAIQKGADLVLIIDPFVPYVSRRPGFAVQRGFLYNIDQNIRTASYTRFEGIRDLVLKQHPHVSCYTFLPRNRLRRLMSVNPMDHRPYLPIWRGAYLSTLERLELLRYRIAGDLAAHGIQLDLSRAQEVAARLRRADAPQLGDFYPDGRFQVRGGSPPVRVLGRSDVRSEVLAAGSTQPSAA